MAKRLILTIGSSNFLIPDDEAQKLGALVEQVSRWFLIEEGEKSWGPRWSYKASEETRVSVSFADDDKISDGMPKAAKEPALEPAEVI